MTTTESHPGPAAILRRATGQRSVSEAVAWLAEDHPIAQSVNRREVLQSLLRVPQEISGHVTALQRLAREIADSQLDSGAVLLRPESIPSPNAHRRVLDLLAHRSPTHSLEGLEAETVANTQRDLPQTIETLCAVAGLTYRDLRFRLHDSIPSNARGEWSRDQIGRAFDVIDSVVCGTDHTSIEDARPKRAIELLFPPFSGEELDLGWEVVEQLRCVGVPYEVLLLQRTVGSPWLAHRLSTSGELSDVVAANLCSILDASGVSYHRSVSVGGDTTKEAMHNLVGSNGKIKLVVLDDRGRPVCAVAMSGARDGGTARKNVMNLTEMAPVGVPMYVLLIGPGWATRNETVQLARAFGGRIYTDNHLEELAADLEHQTSA